jgi:hypothetical protein
VPRKKKNESPQRVIELTAMDRLLIRLLAMRDAYFTPVRDVLDNLNSNAWSMRRRYRETGVPWSSEGKTEAERKVIQRALEQAGKSGLVAIGNAGGRTSDVRLLDAGEHRAASLCLRFTPADGVKVWNALVRRYDAGVMDCWEDDLIPSMPVWLKTPGQSREEALSDLQHLMLPWMVRGFVFGAATLNRNVRYLIDEVPPENFTPGAQTDDSLGSVEAQSIYLDVLNAERKRLSQAQLIDRGEIGPVPFATTAASEEQGAWWKLSAEMAARGE